MTKNVLLIGNGLNRVTMNSAWTDLIQELQNAFDLERFSGYTNYPLEFERIDQAVIASGNRSGMSAKKLIAQHLPVISDFSLIQQFTNLPMDVIMTTNYDYNIEMAIDATYNRRKQKASTTETKHSLNRYTVVNNRRIWHIHGEAFCPNSICMGYEQYCSHLSRLHTILTQPKQNYSKRPYLDHVLIHEDDPNPPWPVLFFTHNIYIVGLQLSLMEIDLWWLLSYRRRLMLLRPDLKINNEIHYYYREGEANDEQRSLLETMGVTLHPMPIVRSNWLKMYMSISNQLTTILCK